LPPSMVIHDFAAMREEFRDAHWGCQENSNPDRSCGTDIVGVDPSIRRNL
jgi:hypothetical protein